MRGNSLNSRRNPHQTATPLAEIFLFATYIRIMDDNIHDEDLPEDVAEFGDEDLEEDEKY